MLAHQLDCDFTAAFVRNVGELGAGLLLECYGDDLIFLSRSRAAHLHLARTRCFDGGDKVFRRFVRRFGVYPEHELIQGHH